MKTRGALPDASLLIDERERLSSHLSRLPLAILGNYLILLRNRVRSKKIGDVDDFHFAPSNFVLVTI